MAKARSWFALDHRPWNHPWTWWALAFGALGLHTVVGFHVLFPGLCLVPILLAAWHRGPRAAVGLTVGVSSLHVGVVALQSRPATGLAAVLDAGVEGVVLGVVALLMAHVAHRAPQPQQPGRPLEGLVTMCAFCKRIRDEHNAWTPVETYLSARRAVTFSHGVCPTCLHVHYGVRDGESTCADRRRTSPAPPGVSAAR